MFNDSTPGDGGNFSSPVLRGTVRVWADFEDEDTGPAIRALADELVRVGYHVIRLPSGSRIPRVQTPSGLWLDSYTEIQRHLLDMAPNGRCRGCGRPL